MRAVRVVTLSMAMVLALGAGCSSDGKKEAAFVRLDPAAFSERMQSDAVLINVHIPYEGELEQTDAFIPYDKIMADDRLPKDKSEEILLYCRTGRMSEEAGAEMNKAGYTKVAHLEGGMKRWEAEGRQLIQNPAHASETPAKDPMQHS
jgi:rhodanese-related sulfurtransferase